MTFTPATFGSPGGASGRGAPWANSVIDELKKVRGVCLDIDDTLSTRGKLTDEAFTALWNLKRAGFFVVPITGRPAGWCDHFARFWPVDAIVGENGAFTFFMKDGIRKRIDTPAGLSYEDGQKKLKALGEEILKRFPRAKWASDQKYREYDLAIDVCEDVPTWPDQDVIELLALCHKAGAHAKLSSIHVNTWFGEYDKKSGFRNWIASGAPGLGTGSDGKSELVAKIPAEDEWLFIGDSPNDEPMFESFKLSVGVANLSRYLDRLKHPPRWITASESGAGFAEMSQRLISSK
jgi:HAD superfamily hydrolase (TIGR01484 family)